ncbi:MAG: glycosyltransferase [Candidatus Moraniibacteriota bacterium]|jgi:Glycosyltransferase Family 4
MKILITNYSLLNYAGTENYVIDIARYFHKSKYEVFVYSPLIGMSGQDIFDDGIHVTSNLLDIANIDFDIIHAHHNIVAIFTRAIFPNVPMIFMSHGVLPKIEQPPFIDINITSYVAVSEEVRDNLVKRHNIDIKKISIIRNFVDFVRFQEHKKVNSVLKNVLVISNHYTKNVKHIIESVCSKLDISLVHVGLPENMVDNVENYINRADIVVTLGKGAIEAMTCKRNVIIYDKHGSDGFITVEKYYKVRENNFSGRRFQKQINQKSFEQLLQKYDPSIAIDIYEIIKKEHSIENACQLLMKQYKDTIKLHEKLSKKEVDIMQKKIKKSKSVLLGKITIFYLKLRRYKEIVSI